MAATVATLRQLTPALYATIGERGTRLMDGIRDALAKAGIPAVVVGFPQVFHVAFGLEAPARSYRDLARSDRAGYGAFVQALLRRGVRALERGAWFLSSEHDDAVIDATLATVAAAAAEVAPALARR
jgi:glutamate-1-semialdehyde 2,1-aminomutase